MGAPTPGVPTQPAAHDPAFPQPSAPALQENPPQKEASLPAPGEAKAFPRPQPFPEVQLRTKKKSGKLAGALGLLLLAGALGAGGWYLREPIQELARKYFPSKEPVVNAPLPGKSVPMTSDASAPAISSVPADDAAGGVFDPTQSRKESISPAPEQPPTPPPVTPVGTPMQNLQPVVVPASGTTTGATQAPASANGESASAVIPAVPTGDAPLAMPTTAPTAPPAEPPDIATTIRPAQAPTGLKPILNPVDADALPKPKSMRPVIIEENPVTAGVPVSPSPGGVIEVPSADGPARGSDPSTAATTSSGPAITTTPEAAPAVDGLRLFFAAKDYMQRSQYVLGAQTILPVMERYYSKMSDGPIPVEDIKLLRYDPKPEIGTSAHAVFTVSSKLWSYPIPIMLQEEKEGFKVDWLAFVEFKDDLLYKFLSDYQDSPARFHVGIRRTHYFENDVPDREGKHCFEIQPPQPSYVGFVFVPKTAPLARELEEKISWETRTAFVIVELQWKKQGDFKWVELSAVPQLNWYSLPLSSKPASSVPPPAKPAGINSAPPVTSTSDTGTTIKSGEGTITKR
jgi:hypothetical protein